MADEGKQTSSNNMYRIARRLFMGLLVLVFVLVIIRVYVGRNFVLTSEVECDPTQGSCFARQCEEDCETEWEFYAIQHVSARYVSTCDPHKEECPAIQCEQTPTCEQELCSAENVPEGEICSADLSLENSLGEEKDAGDETMDNGEGE